MPIVSPSHPCPKCGEPKSPVAALCRPCSIGSRYDTRSRLEIERDPATIKRFLAKVDKASSPTGCWLWTASVGQGGYGIFRVGPRNYVAHRVSYEMTVGAIPADLRVLHRCDTPPCVNPAHLFVGTQHDNMRDMAAKGRQAVQRLSGDDIRAIRALYAAGGITQEEIAQRFGMSRTVICNLVNRKRGEWAA